MKHVYTMVLLFLVGAIWAQKPIDTIPFEVVNGHITVKLSINNGPELDMVFDTGASANLLSQASADALNLETGGSMNVQGAAGSSNMQMTDPVTFKIGNTKIKEQQFLVMDLGHLGEEGHPVSAVLGASVLNRFIVEIDYDNKNLLLYKNNQGPDTQGWQEVKVDLAPFNIPIIEASISLKDGESYTGRYLVDTGAGLTIMFNSNLVKGENLIERFGQHYPVVSKSLSNSEVDQVGKLNSFSLFGHTFENFETRLSQATQGVNAFPGFHGIIGLEVLKRFNTIYDYANSRMFLKPNTLYNEVFPKSYSGLRVEKEKSHFRVLGVIDDSAGSDAKIEEGDLVVSLDGKTFDTRSDFSRYFQTANSTIDMVLLRDGKKMAVEFKPRPTID